MSSNSDSINSERINRLEQQISQLVSVVDNLSEQVKELGSDLHSEVFSIKKEAKKTNALTSNEITKIKDDVNKGTKRTNRQNKNIINVIRYDTEEELYAENGEREYLLALIEDKPDQMHLVIRISIGELFKLYNILNNPKNKRVLLSTEKLQFSFMDYYLIPIEEDGEIFYEECHIEPQCRSI